MDPLWRPYLLAQVPGWGLTATALWIAHELFTLPLWAALALFSMLVLKDLLLFPRMRRFYQSDDPEGRIIGERGTAITDLEPTGFVHVRGELWQAECDSRIAKGAAVRVRAIRGLTLRVELLRGHDR